jgi:thiol-disulfide isomerase/thioredoxin
MTGMWIIAFALQWVLLLLLTVLMIGTLRYLGLVQKNIHLVTRYTSRFEEGDRVGHFELADLKGLPVVSEALLSQDKKTLLFFLTPGCGGCKAVISQIADLAKKDQDHGDFIDGITGFAMRQASRRGFIKWVAKGGVALAAAMTTGFDLLTRNAYAAINCSDYLSGCEGRCSCGYSVCEDPDTGAWFDCEGSCDGGCGQDPVYYLVREYWFWGTKEGKCLSNSLCVECEP